MPNYFQGTIQTLSGLIQQEKAARLQRETPQYQAALMRLMEMKEDQAFKEQQGQLLASLGQNDPKYIPTLYGAVGGRQGVGQYYESLQKAQLDRSSKEDFELWQKQQGLGRYYQKPPTEEEEEISRLDDLIEHGKATADDKRRYNYMVGAEPKPTTPAKVDLREVQMQKFQRILDSGGTLTPKQQQWYDGYMGGSKQPIAVKPSVGAPLKAKLPPQMQLLESDAMKAMSGDPDAIKLMEDYKKNSIESEWAGNLSRRAKMGDTEARKIVEYLTETPWKEAVVAMEQLYNASKRITPANVKYVAKQIAEEKAK